MRKLLSNFYNINLTATDLNESSKSLLETYILFSQIKTLITMNKFKTALYHINKAEDLINSDNVPKKFLASIKMLKGWALMDLNDIKHARNELLKGLSFADKYDNQGIFSSILIHIGNSYYFQNNLKKAREYYHRAIGIKEVIRIFNPGDEHNLREYASALNNLGAIKRKTGDNEKALSFFLKSIEFEESMKSNSPYYAITLHNAANIYLNEGKIRKFRKYLNKAVTIYDKVGDRKNMLTLILLECEYLITREDYKSALDKLNRVLKIAREIRSFRQLFTVHSKLAKVFEKLNNLKRCKNHLEKALKYAEELGDKSSAREMKKRINSIY